MLRRAWVSSLLMSCVTTGCLSTLPFDLERGGRAGPKVLYDPLARPFPVAPTPSDAATRYDAHSPTSRRLNLSLIDHIQEERDIRAELNKLEGFALFSPISVPLIGQLDLATVDPQSVFVVELPHDADQELRAVSLDLGDSFFPINSSLKWMLGLPPEPQPPNLLFSADNQVNSLQWRSDEDRLAALMRYQRGDEAHLTHYEVASDTLIVRSLRPLKPHTLYAVLLSDQLAGWSEEGEYGAVRSPFAGIASTKDAKYIERAARWLKREHQREVVFGWTFTTGDPKPMLKSVRDGLYGEGALSALAFSPALTEIRETGVSEDTPSPQWHSRLLPASYLERFSGLAATVTSNSGYAIEFSDVDYFVFGNFSSPQLRSEDREWIVEPAARGGFRFSQPPRLGEIPFLLSVPKSSAQAQPPFPVVIYFHGTNSSRVEGIILSQELARQGIALLSFDQIGHGPLLRNYKTFNVDNPQFGAIVDILPTLIARFLAPDRISEVEGKPFSEGIEALSDLGLFRELAVLGRWEDVNQDGAQSEAEGFFDTNPAKLCAAFWQDSVDAMSLVKLLRNLDPRAVPPRLARPDQLSPERLEAHLLAGDFNADGVLDIGGPQVQISAAGTSLGGIHSLLVGAIEPEIEVVTPIVPGAGLIDILSRTGLRFLARPLFESYLGQAIVGCPNRGRDARSDETPTQLFISLNDDSLRCDQDLLESSARFTLEGDWRGAEVVLYNRRSQDEVRSTVNERGGFLTQISSERGDRIKVTVIPTSSQEMSQGLSRFEAEIEAEVNGYGRELFTPDFRRATYTLNQLLERCDPIAFTGPYQPERARPVKTLVSVALGDSTVPINTAVSLANALGLLGESESEWRPRLEALRDRGVLLGVSPESVWDPEADPNAPLYDVDQVLNRDTLPPDAIGPIPPREVGDGYSAIRFANVNGAHEWIAGYERDGFSYSRYSLRQIAAYHRCGGRLILDDDPLCLQAEECPIMDHLYLRADCQ